MFGIVGGGDQIDIMGALFLQFTEDLGQAGGRNGTAFGFLGDIEVLAEGAAHVATAKEDSAAALPSGEAGFFPMMKGGPSQIEGIGDAADAVVLGSVCPATAGAEGT